MMPRLFLTMCVLVAVGMPALSAGAAAEPVAAVTGPIVGAAAPDFTLTTIDGRTLRLADYRGRTLVINVWGSWCPPCRLETPDLIAESTADRARGVAFVGIDTTESAAAVRAFAVAKGVGYPQVATTGSSAFARDYDIRNYPTTFVIGPDGILRARHADNLLPRAQLHAYIVAARDGRSAPLRSALQTRLDALLDPAAYPLDGDDATVRANVQRAIVAIDQTDALMDDAMDDQTQDHDLVATQAEQERLRAAVIAAFTPLAKSDADTALLARLRGDEAVAQGRWSDADTAYAAALAIDPADRDALDGQAYAAAELGDDARVEQLDTRIAQLAPSPSAFVSLGKAQARRGEIAAAEASFGAALGLAQTPVAVAWTNLYFGRMEAEAGRRAAAHAAFAHALAAATAIPTVNPRSAWYIEQAQEGMVALGVTPGAPPSLSLAPWTGPDLPGSIASTIKYRLAVTGAHGTSVALTVRGLPLHWIGSFCTDRVCAPFTTTVVVPADGVKIVEFQVVPIGRASTHQEARIDATVGKTRVATASVPT
jgi:peroxiredoxin